MNKLTDMIVEKRADDFVINFSGIKKNDYTPFIFDTKYNFPNTKNTNLHFSFKESDASTQIYQKTPKENLYNFFNPTELGVEAFSNHHGFVVSPQMIGAQLLLDFGTYVSKNLEKCASIFNGKVGEKKEIKVWLNPGESLASLDVLARATSDWERTIKEHTNPKLRDVIHPNFSKNNRVIDIVYAGLVMGAAKDFFEYSFSTLCGIPKITVEGKKSDWQKIALLTDGLASVEELSELKPFYDWVRGTVVQGVIDLHDGKEDNLFWSSIIKYESQSGVESRGGWLPSLNLYEKAGLILPMNNRWTANNQAEQCEHLLSTVTKIHLVSDNNSGVPNADPDLDIFVGFTGASFNEGDIKPVLGIDGYRSK